MAAEKCIGEVLSLNELFLIEGKLHQWGLKKMYGIFKMATSQQFRHGNGQGWDSSRTEKITSSISLCTWFGFWTQYKLGVFAKQVAECHYKNIAINLFAKLCCKQLVPKPVERYNGVLND